MIVQARAPGDPRWPRGWFEDASGEVWYSRDGRTVRERGRRAICEQCSREYFAPVRRRSKYCSKSCWGSACAPPAKCRRDLFEQWTPSEAWLAGLIWADGCLLVSPRNGHQHVLVVTTDEEMAIDAAEVAGTVAGTDYLRKRHNGRDGYSRKPIYTVRIGSRFAIARLRDQGLVPRKSLDCEFPLALPGPAVPAFVRGYFDGDGSVGVYRNKSIRSASHKGRLIASFNGSLPFLLSLRELLHRRAGTPENKLIRNGAIWRLQVNHADALRLAAFMYQDDGPRLTRKAEIFQAWTCHG